MTKFEKLLLNLLCAYVLAFLAAYDDKIPSEMTNIIHGMLVDTNKEIKES